MPIRVDAYTAGGVASGVLARPGHLRDVLETNPELTLERVSWLVFGAPAARPAGEVSIPVDDVLIAVTDDDPTIPVHAAWHDIHLEVGPFVLDGQLPTLPGFDPGRALTRPTGEFVLLRDVRIALASDPTRVAGGTHALINRYGVELVRSDIMLGFFFPGAAMDGLEEQPASAASPAAAAPAPAASAAAPAASDAPAASATPEAPAPPST